jgi:hypothetical protein
MFLPEFVFFTAPLSYLVSSWNADGNLRAQVSLPYKGFIPQANAQSFLHSLNQFEPIIPAGMHNKKTKKKPCTARPLSGPFCPAEVTREPARVMVHSATLHRALGVKNAKKMIDSPLFLRYKKRLY